MHYFDDKRNGIVPSHEIDNLLVIQRILAKHQALRTELGGLKKTYAGSVSLRCHSLNDQCDLLEEILGIPLSYPRGTQEDR